MMAEPLTFQIHVEGGETAAVQLHRVSDAVEHVSSSSKRAERDLGGFARGMYGLRTAFSYALGAGGFAGLAFGIGDAIKNAQALQVATSAMSNAVRDSGLPIKATTKSLMEFADALSVRGGFSPVETITGLTNLVRVTKNQADAEKLMTLATNIARGAHVSFKSSVRGVMMAEEGRLTGLTRLGIVLPKTATATQALAMLQQRFAGATTAYSRTSQGAMGNLSHVLDILGEKIGGVITPIVAGAARAMMTFIDGWQKMTGVGGQAHAIFSTLVADLGAVWGWIKSNSTMLLQLGIVLGSGIALWKAYRLVVFAAGVVQAAFASGQTVLAFLQLLGAVRSLRDVWVLLDIAMDANAIGAIIVGVAALAAGFVVLYNKVRWFRNAVNDTWSFVKKYWPLMLAVMTGGTDFAIIYIVKHWSSVTKVFSSVAHAVSSIWRGMINGIISAINVVIGVLDSMSVHIPSWVPGIGGSTFGFNIGKVSPIGSGPVKATKGHTLVDTPKGIRNVPIQQSPRVIKRFAEGGLVYGQGRMDTVPARLTPHEYVATTAMVDSVGAASMDRWRAGGSPPGDNGGGVVQALENALSGMAVVMDGKQVGIVMVRQGLNAKALR